MSKHHPSERWVAWCSRQQAEVLIRYDHHQVQVQGRPALLLTYLWMMDLTPLDEMAEPLLLTVDLTYPENHPVAPDSVQWIVDQLEFTQQTT